MKIFKRNKSAHLVNLLDEQSFRALFDLYWKRLVAFCQYYTQDDDLAMDIVQDIFCSLWNRKDSIQLHNEVEYYLYRAARLKINDFFREKYKREDQHSCLSQDFCDTVNNTEETIYYRDLHRFVQGLVNNLPCRCKQVYSLSRNSGLSIPEIASQLKLSEKTVEAHLTKALRFLKENLHLQRSQK